MRSEGPKPREVLELHDVCSQVFDALRTAFDVSGTFTFDLTDVDHIVDHRVEAREIAAFAMRGMQIVRAYATPTRPVANDHFVAIASRAMSALEKLADLVPDDRQRTVLLDARERFYDATWAVMRDAGPDSGLCLLQ